MLGKLIFLMFELRKRWWRVNMFRLSFQVSGLGAGMDSFYEYLLKSYILFEEKSDLAMFTQLYSSVKQVFIHFVNASPLWTNALKVKTHF